VNDHEQCAGHLVEPVVSPVTALVRSLAGIGGDVRFLSLAAAGQAGVSGLETAPRSLRVLAENVLWQAVWARRPGAVDDSMTLVQRLVAAGSGAAEACEAGFLPSRLIFQDHSGLPVLADLAALRDLLNDHGLDPRAIGPSVPVDVVVDHSVEAGAHGPGALRTNMAREFRLNAERYRFLRWAQQAMPHVRVVPPGHGIMHQMHLEHLAKVVMVDGRGYARPDTVLGTDSHTPMVNSLGVLGWGVGGIEALSVLLGQPVGLLSPRVVGVRLVNSVPPGVMSTDLALTLTALLRSVGVVGAFVEFFGAGLRSLTVPMRAALANMAPEYGCTVAYFPVDAATIAYLRLAGRDDGECALVDAYAREQGLFAEPGEDGPGYAQIVEFDLAAVEVSAAGPARPRDRVPVGQVPATFPGGGRAAARPGRAARIPDGSVAIAAITSCTSTSDPEAMIAAGLLARNAARRGLTPPPWVKTSLAPGSRVVTAYLDGLGLQAELESIGFHVAGYGCTTCIGNSGPLAPAAAEAVRRDGARLAAVLSGNRNFPGRIHPDVAAAYLMSPPLVVAYAIAGTVLVDITSQPVATGPDGRPVHLAELWPSPEEIAEAAAIVGPALFRRERSLLFAADPQWAALEPLPGPLYDWPAGSTYLRPSPFAVTGPGPWTPEIRGARVLVHTGDGTTTDDISPAGMIPASSPAGRYLREHGVPVAEFNSFGCRRGNHEVLVRGTFGNPRFVNRLGTGRPGPWTIHWPSGDEMLLVDAAQRYASTGTPLLILAGKAYGTGSSRDWAAKGPRLLGVRAVLAESFERIHRANLTGMGILPLVFEGGQGAASLGLTGREIFDCAGLGDLVPRGEVTVTARRSDGTPTARWRMRAAVDTAQDLQVLRRGGILPAVATELLAGRGRPAAGDRGW
jgi:aconitate hydratase A / 2-methylisocitrate dehydratase